MGSNAQALAWADSRPAERHGPEQAPAATPRRRRRSVPVPAARTVALIPAKDEAATIQQAVTSVANQVDRVLVVANNCSDDTAGLARLAGAEVIELHDVRRRKAEALNRALRRVLPGLEDTDHVLVVDADSTLAEDWVVHAAPVLARPDVGAVGGIFYGQRGAGLLGQLQRMEYVRYARQLARRSRGQAFVLTGTATMLKVWSLRAVAQARATGRLPGGREGEVVFYDEHNITEDSELTMAVKHVGLRCESPMECWVSTEIMPTVRRLWVQRTRWQHGALTNLRSYGLTAVTLPYLLRQVWSYFEMLFLSAYVTITGITVAAGTFRFSPFWLAVGLVFVSERVVSVWRGGWVARALAATMLIELAYGLGKHAVNLVCLWKVTRNRSVRWS